MRLPRPPETALAAFAIYALAALVLFGLPVLDQLASRTISLEQNEAGAYVWFLSWWPSAILNGENPLTTDYVFYPEGYNMAWAGGSSAGPALALTPVTLAFGPVVAYNLLSLGAPTLSAFTGFLLCRKLTAAFWPSLVGGFVFGFSGLVLGALSGVPNLAVLFCLPLFVLLAIRFCEGSVDRGRFALYLALLLVAQFLISVEVFAMVSVFGGLVGLLAYFLMPQLRDRLRAGVIGVGVAYAGALLAVSPFLYYIFFEPHLDPDFAVPEQFSSDLLSFVVPTSQQALSGGPFESLAGRLGGVEAAGTGGGGNAYLGLPLLAIAVLFARERWHERGAKLLVIALAALAVFSLGPRLHVAGELVPGAYLPWKPFTELPLLEYALPARFPAFTALAMAIVVSLWLAARPSAGRWALAGLAVLLCLPAVGSERWQAPAETPEFFAGGAWEQALDREDHVLAVPPIGPVQRWQAQTRMSFRLTSGYIGKIPDDYAAVHELLAAWGPGALEELRRFIDVKRVTAVLIAEDHELWRRRLRPLGVQPTGAGGVLLYRLSPAGS